MSDETKVTEKEAVLRERMAYAHGMVRGSAKEFRLVSEVEAAAAKAYPLPKVTRPRVVVEACGMGWKVENGKVLYSLWAKGGPHAQPWLDAEHEGAHEITAERVAMWADLLANPTEEVDAE